MAPLHWSVVVVTFTRCPWKLCGFSTSALLCFCERFGQQPRRSARHTSAVKCSGIIFLSLFPLRCAPFHICDFYQKQSRNRYEMTPSYRTLSWLFQTIWWSNWSLLQKLFMIDLSGLDCVWICASCLWSLGPCHFGCSCFVSFWEGGRLRNGLAVERPRLSASNLDELNSWVIALLLILACFLFQLCLNPS